MDVLSTIIPIFTVIFIGWIIRIKGGFPAGFINTANRLVFNIGIPALVFKSIANADFFARFHFAVVFITLASVIAATFIIRRIGKALDLENYRFGIFIQSSMHGNLGYVGLAVAYYYLGNEGLSRAAIIASFLILVQNFISVTALIFYSEKKSEKVDWKQLLIRLSGNPIIISAILAIVISISQIDVPVILNRTVDILSGMALPLALLIIGTSLSFDVVRVRLKPVLISGILKLVMLPLIAYPFYLLLGIAPEQYLPGMILLSCPTATVSYIMAKEMTQEEDFAVAAISVSTLLSALTFTGWLALTQ